MKSLYLSLIQFLECWPCRKVAYFFSHGGTHFLSFILAFLAGWYCYNRTTSDSGPIAHRLVISVDREQTQLYENPDAKLYQLHIELTLNSDSVDKKTHGYTRNRLEIRALPDGLDSLGTQVSIGMSPYQEKIMFDKDFDSTVKEAYMVNQPTDSTLSIDLAPERSIELPSGKFAFGPQRVEIYSNNLGVKSNNPYYYYYIGLDIPETSDGQTAKHPFTTFSFQLGDHVRFKNLGYIHQNKDLKYNFIYPEPDVINGAWIYYYTKETIDKVLANHGVVIQAEDIQALNKSNRENFLYSVLVGLFAALFFDIFIQLIREWRNINLRNDQARICPNEELEGVIEEENSDKQTDSTQE